MRKLIYTYIILLFFSSAEAQINATPYAIGEESSSRVDSILGNMTLEQKIGQLMMIRAYSNKGHEHKKAILNLIETYRVGGLCFFQGSPVKQATLTNAYQSMSETPLLVAMDAEWGLGMRHKEDAVSFPKQLFLGAQQNDSNLYRMGFEIGKQLRAIGVHFNFAPVVDVNNNIDNPVIGERSFGESRENVARKGVQYSRGLQDAGVIACAKHFPGHGDTDTDSHVDLPVISHSKEHLDSIEIYPFRKMIENKVGAIMVAHLHVPALDDRAQRPSSLSKGTVTELLKENLQFTGLIVTDGMEMGGVTKHFPSGKAEAEALLAGNDIILLPRSVPAAISQIKLYIEEGKITVEQIEKSAKKILLAKERLGLFEKSEVDVSQVKSRIFNAETEAIKRDLIEESITLVRNQNSRVPFVDLEKTTYASLAIGVRNITAFQNRLNSYTRVINFTSQKYPDKEQQKRLISQLGSHDKLVISFHAMSNSGAKNYGIDPLSIELAKELQKKTDVVVVLFGSPYAAGLFDEFETLLVAYDDNELVQDITAQGIFGAISFRGKLPVSSSPKAKEGMGVTSNYLQRLGWGSPEQVGMNSDSLSMIEDIVEEMIDDGATPGCQVLVAKNGKIVYQKAFGHKTYKAYSAVRNSDIYDLASVTKVASTTLSMMKLQETGKVSVSKTLGDYFQPSKNSSKGKMKIEDILSHRAGFKSWIPFYKETLDKSGKPSTAYYSSVSSRKHSIPVAKNLYLDSDYKEKMIDKIMSSAMNKPGNYVYSDLGMICLAEMIKEQTGSTVDEYVANEYYRPLGLRKLRFNPHKNVSRASIVPSEIDSYFRHQELRGHVHDMGSAILGGVAGHAGLFGNSSDLAVVFQLLLNKGYYGGKQYLSPETITYFTSRVEGASRRAVGFDMKQLDPEETINMSPLASHKAFGHLGFTGIAAWADPQYDLIYIFLSNRTFPTMENKKLAVGDYRPRIQSIAYRAITQLQP